MNNEVEVLSDEPGHSSEITSSDALQSLERASIDMQISTARKFPRQLKVVIHKMEQAATLDQETAESCFYSLPRGGKNIEGPSVRLAEIALNSYGNLRFASRNISVVATGDQPHVVCQAVVHDLENNVLGAVEKRRRITAKKKNNGRVDEDDINLAVNACSSIALRDATFKVVPLALIKPVYNKAVKVAIGDASSLTDRRNKAIERFGKMGVIPERILLALGKGTIEEIGLEELKTLSGMRTAITEGTSDIDDLFPKAPVAGAGATTQKLVPKEGEDNIPMGGTQGGQGVNTGGQPEQPLNPAKPKTAKAKTVTAGASAVTTPATPQTPTAPPVTAPAKAPVSGRRSTATMVEEPLDEPLPTSTAKATAPAAAKVEATPPPNEETQPPDDGGDVL